MYTINQIARQLGVTRTTLIYYEKIGLISPTSRTKSGYRLYSKFALVQLRKMMAYREAGLPLAEIKKLKTLSNHSAAKILENHLVTLNNKIQKMRQQQQQILKLLKNEALITKTRIMNKQQWVAILRASGLSDEEMLRWHIEFEANAPEAHQDFLESLGISADEIKQIRITSKSKTKK